AGEMPRGRLERNGNERGADREPRVSGQRWGTWGRIFHGNYWEADLESDPRELRRRRVRSASSSALARVLRSNTAPTMRNTTGTPIMPMLVVHSRLSAATMTAITMNMNPRRRLVLFFIRLLPVRPIERTGCPGDASINR